MFQCCQIDLIVQGDKKQLLSLVIARFRGIPKKFELTLTVFKTIHSPYEEEI